MFTNFNVLDILGVVNKIRCLYEKYFTTNCAEGMAKNDYVDFKIKCLVEFPIKFILLAY
jgi:hypothetical protein